MIYNLDNPLEVKMAEKRFKKLLEEKCHIDLKKKLKKRSLALNAYSHVVYSIFAIEFGYTLDESKTHLKRSCDFMRYTKNGEVFLKRTREMDNKELTEFVEWIRNHASLQGCYIPTADEYLEQQFSIDKEIANHKEHL